ncbi:uncharacterized protein LOC117909586 [Vitis riparia]|uniref:uncharacterized protein LOC117909586 n=1 Tax=Vitis riparia TaxID=96939 RepID=UPI00155ADC91|nr:uncharacterized protein LOC117909586 [Vitis riparia]
MKMSSIGTSKGILEVGKFALYVSIPIGLMYTLANNSENMKKLIQKDCQPLLGSPRARQELTRSGLNLRPLQQGETSKPLSGLTKSDQFVKIDQTVSRPVLLDTQVLRKLSSSHLQRRRMKGRVAERGISI